MQGVIPTNIGKLSQVCKTNPYTSKAGASEGETLIVVQMLSKVGQTLICVEIEETAPQPAACFKKSGPLLIVARSYNTFLLKHRFSFASTWSLIFSEFHLCEIIWLMHSRCAISLELLFQLVVTLKRDSRHLPSESVRQRSSGETAFSCMSVAVQ